MKCPLIAIGLAITEDQHWLQDSDCLKEECAAWVTICNQCSITVLAINIAAICALLLEIKDKMPPEEQFRRR